MGKHRFEKYGILWDPKTFPDSASVEVAMCRAGGYVKQQGNTFGKGMLFHFRKFQELLWPDLAWHRWRELQIKCFVEHRYIGEMGCAASGKTTSAGANCLADWYLFPDCTTSLVSSTDLPSLDLRIWGTIKRLHKVARKRLKWIPGNLIEGRRMIVFDAKMDFEEGRDFRNGIIAVPCKKGDTYIGLSNWIGVHNKRVRLFADELSLMPRAFIDTAANLSKCEDFKLVGYGNPNETTNAHGILCEPAVEIGGWEAGIDQTPKTKTWKTKFPDGICIQLPGSDCPNMDADPSVKVPFPYLMTRKQMDEDGMIWGKDDWHFAMMNDARMPRGQGSRRIITRQSCLKFGATLEPMWRDMNITKIGCLDASYRGVGGDRCVFGELNFGIESESDSGIVNLSPLLLQNSNVPQGRQIIALVDLSIIPILGGLDNDSPEDQIVRYCQSECEKRGISADNFAYDAGMRTSLVTAFSRIWTPMVNSVDFGGSPSGDKVSADIDKLCSEYYAKFVTELWFSVRLCIEARQFRGLTQEAMWEFCAREWKQNIGTNKIEVEPKDQMKIKTGRSPDLADTIVTGLWMARKRGFNIAKLRAPDSDKPKRNPFDGPDWRKRLLEASKATWEKSVLEQSSN